MLGAKEIVPSILYMYLNYDMALLDAALNFMGCEVILWYVNVGGCACCVLVLRLPCCSEVVPNFKYGKKYYQVFSNFIFSHWFCF